MSGVRPSAPRDSRFDAGAADAATLGSLLDGSFQTTTTEHFVLFHEPDARYVPIACEALEHAYQQFYDAFARAGFDLAPPAERLVWICFPQKGGFNRYALQVEGMDLSWLDGYYSTLTNRVAIVQANPGRSRLAKAAPPTHQGLGVAVAANRAPQDGAAPLSPMGKRFDIMRLTHEVAHQLSFNSGIQKRGVMYPLWVSEGLATNFEFDRLGESGLEYGNTARCTGLLDAYATGELVPLQEFVVQTTVPPDTRVSRRHYAQAWGFFHFVLTEHPDGLRTYLRRLAAQGADSHDAQALLAEFTQAFDSPEVLEASWQAFLARQAQQRLARYSAAAATARTP